MPRLGVDRAIGLGLKRCLDLALGSAALVVLAPVMGAVALTVQAVEGGPAIFRQTRVGLDGRTFTMLKFRTMIRDAEAYGDALAPLNEVQGNAFKLANDGRLTRTGGFLRRSSLDELPQLVNVLKGEMSLVGPRPPLPEEVAAYDPWHRRRLSVKPGMTGLWQVEGRSDPIFDRWVQLDLEYIDSWSLRLDLAILLRTIPAVLGGQGR